MGKFDGMLIASDMDGTLLNDQRAVEQETIEALQYFTREGGYFAIATGRTRPATEAYRRILPCSGANVYLNGAIVCDEREESLVFMEGLDDRAKEIAKQIMREFPHIGIEVFLLNHSYVCNQCDVTRRHFINLAIPYTEIEIDDIPEPTSVWGKINFTGEPDQVGEVREALKEAEQYYNLTFSTPVFYEMTCKGGHKGDGVQRLADYLHIRPENICTVGDSQNDIPMLKMAGTSFAPSNARQDVLSIADVVVQDNNHNTLRGVVEYLEQHRK